MVLGAGGWLGSHLVASLLASGRPVLGVDIFFDDRLRGLAGLETIEADMRSVDRFAPRLPECATVFNCSGVLHPPITQDLYSINRDAPVAVYKACMAAGVGSFVHVSSINAQGANPDPRVPLDESMPLRPFTHYGVSKAEGDTALQAIAAPGTRLVILRPGVFYGEEPSRNLRELFVKIRTSRLPYFTQDGCLRTYVDVKKFVEALLLAEVRGQPGGVYLIGDEEPLSTQHFYQVLAAALGVKAKTFRAPLALATLCEKLAFYAGKRNIHLRLPTIVGEFGRNIFCDVSKSKRELGFEPAASSEPGLARMVRSVE